MSCLSVCFKPKTDVPKYQAKENDEDMGDCNVKMYTYKEMQLATDNFSIDNKIGQGGFGSVYRGKLKDGTLVALKLLSAQSKQGLREFLTEIIVISSVTHENLVHLYGCCVESSQRILVYGYIEYGSLDQTLLGRKQSSIQFDWNTRSRICIGVARGLAYLHEELRPRIIHRDIKASNILLSKDLIPKISDFGLAKLFPDHLTHVTTRVTGTLGYLAPEYAVRGQLTRKADIYSFGVLLMEIVSGRCHTNKQLPTGDQHILEMAWKMYEEGSLAELVDISIELDKGSEEAFKFLKIGLLCTQGMPKLRPSMSEVVKMLTGKRNVDEKTITKPGLLSELMIPQSSNDTSSINTTLNVESGQRNESSSFENYTDETLPTIK
ncbi:cold-responsive protein kinase 1-like [Impatiens glandulifera]|uniref:cold-responsive protein kinase 1-like n=1 Tax=Impatiens glandulifera TaxID=253017 RepID=UPI001FB0E83B|nr:cold-responsive protein kinase 1-like [Impatiens glandulifera]